MKKGRFFYSLLSGFLLFAISFAVAQDKNTAEGGKATYKIDRNSNVAALKTSMRYDKMLPVNSPLQVRWALPMGSGKVKRISMPAKDNGLMTILVETDQNDLIAINRDTGEAMWWLKLQKEILGDIFIGKFHLLLVTDGRIVCLERVSGDVIWNVALPFPPSSGPGAAEDGPDTLIIIVPGLDRGVYAFDVTQERWPDNKNYDFDKKDGFSLKIDYYRPRWSFHTNGVAVSNPVYDDGMVFTGGWGKEVYGMSINSRVFNGQPESSWNHKVRGACVASPVPDGPNILFPSMDQTLYCLTTDQGATLWRYIATEGLFKAPQLYLDANIDKTYILQKVGKAGPVIALDPVGGKPLWSLDNVDGVVGAFEARGEDRLLRALAVCSGPDGQLTAVQVSAPDKRSEKQKQADEAKQAPRKATILWSIKTPFTNFVRNNYESSIYCTNADGSVLYALQEND